MVGTLRRLPGITRRKVGMMSSQYLFASDSVGNYKETAGDKPEEGGDDVKSSWPLRVGLHTCYNGEYRGLPNCKVERIPESFS